MPPRTNLEILTVALYLLGGDRHRVSTEDVAVTANELAPGRFAWRKYRDQINLELVRVYLSDLKKKANGIQVHGSGSGGWMLTPTGLEVASRAVLNLDPKLLAREPISPLERRRYANEKARMLETTAYKRQMAGRLRGLSRREAEELFRVDDYVVGAARERKIQRALTAFKDDPELAVLLQRAAEVLLGWKVTDDR